MKNNTDKNIKIYIKIKLMKEDNWGKTFTSQFMDTGTADLGPAIAAIKNNRVDLLNQMNAEQMKLSGEKSLLKVCIYHGNCSALLYLLRRDVPVTLDQEQNNITHICAHYGRVECLETIHFHQKVLQTMKLYSGLMSALKKHNYKRTDFKHGELKYSVSGERMKSFYHMQDQLLALYQDYYANTLGHYLTQIKHTNSKHRNALHTVCFNRYQKCLRVLQHIMQQFHHHYLVVDGKVIQEYQETNQYMEEKVDPRIYEDTLQLVEEALPREEKQKLEQEYQKKIKECIHELLSEKDTEHNTPLHIATKVGCTAMINLLKRYEGKQGQEEKEEIMSMASHNLARSHIMDLCDASKLSDTKSMNFLLMCGEEVNKKKTIYGTFPLLEASKAFADKTGTLEPVNMLLKSGANINEQDTNGWTVLHHACAMGNRTIVEKLVKEREKNKLNINIFTNKRYHALHLAAMRNHPEIIEVLLSGEAKVDVRDWDERTPLHHAAKKGAVQALSTLLKHKASLNAIDIRKMNALHFAASGNHTACIRELLNADSDKDELRNARNSKGKLPKDLCSDSKLFRNIFTACRKGDINIIRELISQDDSLKNVNTPQKQRTPLIIAVLAKSLLSVRYLVEIGVDQYHEDSDGKSAKDHAIQTLHQAKKDKNKKQIELIEQIQELLKSD